MTAAVLCVTADGPHWRRSDCDLHWLPRGLRDEAEGGILPRRHVAREPVREAVGFI